MLIEWSGGWWKESPRERGRAKNERWRRQSRSGRLSKVWIGFKQSL